MSLSQNEISDKSRLATLFWGLVALHRFYTGKIVSGIFFLLTLGGLGIWWIIDIIMILSGSFKDKFGKFIINWNPDKKTIMPPIVVFVVLLVILSLAGGHGKSGVHITDGEVKYSYKTEKFQTGVVKVEKRTRVGSEYLYSEPASGGIYVAVQWVYENITQKPINSFNFPKIELIAPDGTSYNPDVGASVYYAGEVDPDNKILSDLNPGIKVYDSDAYELSKESLRTKGWKLVIKADQDIVEFPLSNL